MIERYLMGDLAGVARVRTSRPGHDATDVGLDPRFVAFDSSWRSALRWYAGGIVAGSALTGGIYNRTWLSLGTTTGIYQHKVLNVPGISKGTHTAIVLAKYNVNDNWYQCAAMIEDDVLRISPYMANPGSVPGILNQFTYYYWVFSVNPETFDPTEDNLSNSMLFGNHPSRGPGLFISRRGTDILTCPDDDLVLSTQKNYFQFYQTGTATRGAQLVATDQEVTINLGASYPDRPPIVAWRSNTGTISPVYAVWVNDSSIRIRLAFTTLTAVTYHWGLIATDPTYAGGVGTIKKPRLLMSQDFGIGITKKNIGWNEAGATDWIFRSDRMPLQFRDYSTIMPNTFAPGLYSYPAGTESSSGPPFSMFQMNLSNSSWVGLGWVSSIAIRNPANGAPREWIALLSATETQYRIQKDSSVSFSGIPSYAGVANVANF